MPLRDTRRLPPGGWIYEQAGFKLNSMSPFADAAKELSQFRKKNALPRSSIEESMEDLGEATCQRLGQDPQWCIDPELKKNWTAPNLFQAAASHVRLAATALLSGSQLTLQEMFGDGLQPVSRELAQTRADVCSGRLTGRPCPCHQKVPIDPFSGPVADAIKRHVEKKTELKLEVDGEEKLLSCSHCWCQMNLKIWQPIQEIIDRTPAGMMQGYKDKTPNCWIVTEQNPAK